MSVFQTVSMRRKCYSVWDSRKDCCIVFCWVTFLFILGNHKDCGSRYRKDCGLCVLDSRKDCGLCFCWVTFLFILGNHKDCGSGYRKYCGSRYRKDCGLCSKGIYYFYYLYYCFHWFYVKNLELQFLYEMWYLNKVVLFIIIVSPVLWLNHSMLWCF